MSGAAAAGDHSAMKIGQSWTFEQRSASGEIAYPASTVRELMQLSEELGIPLEA